MEVRHSPVMERQYLNVIFAASIALNKATEGLCGYMDNDEKNDFYGPDGTLYTDAVEFAESCKAQI